MKLSNIALKQRLHRNYNGEYDAGARIWSESLRVTMTFDKQVVYTDRKEPKKKNMLYSELLEISSRDSTQGFRLFAQQT